MPYGPPALMAIPAVAVVEVGTSEVTFVLDGMNARRVVHLDQQSPPASARVGTARPFDRSLGRGYAGRRTTGFSAQPNGYAFDLPSSAAKRIVERFALSADRKHLEYEATVEDAEYLAAPVTHRSQWDYRPGLKRPTCRAMPRRRVASRPTSSDRLCSPERGVRSEAERVFELEGDEQPLSIIERFFGKRAPQERTPDRLVANPSIEKPLSLQVLFPAAPRLDALELSRALRTFDQSTSDGRCDIDENLLREGKLFGLAGWGRHVVRFLGFDAPMPERAVDACIAPAHFGSDLKLRAREHRAHVILYYAGYDPSPLEQYVALAVVAAVFGRNEGSRS